MHWVHARTKDFIRWEYLPAALAPDAPYDQGGCFSGGAVQTPDGRQLLLYTGVKDGPEGTFQTQCAAIGDGVNYEKYPYNPVITAVQLPEGSSTRDFRDPKIWWEQGSYHAVAVNRGKDGSGDVLLFGSEDGLSWQRKSILFSCGYRFGTMWCCILPQMPRASPFTPMELRACPSKNTLWRFPKTGAHSMNKKDSGWQSLICQPESLCYFLFWNHLYLPQPCPARRPLQALRPHCP